MSIGFGEILLVLIVCFLVVGPSDLPKVARGLARFVKKVRTTMKDISKAFEEDLEMSELKETGKEISKVHDDFEKVQQDVLKHAGNIEDTKL